MGCPRASMELIRVAMQLIQVCSFYVDNSPEKLTDGGASVVNRELILTLEGVKTNELFNLDLFLNTDIAAQF